MLTKMLRGAELVAAIGDEELAVCENGHPVGADQRFCGECGAAAIEVRVSSCPLCGIEIDATAFCTSCGAARDALPGIPHDLAISLREWFSAIGKLDRDSLLFKSAADGKRRGQLATVDALRSVGFPLPDVEPVEPWLMMWEKLGAPQCKARVIDAASGDELVLDAGKYSGRLASGKGACTICATRCRIGIVGWIKPAFFNAVVMRPGALSIPYTQVVDAQVEGCELRIQASNGLMLQIAWSAMGPSSFARLVMAAGPLTGHGTEALLAGESLRAQDDANSAFHDGMSVFAEAIAEVGRRFSSYEAIDHETTWTGRV